MGPEKTLSKQGAGLNVWNVWQAVGVREVEVEENVAKCFGGRKNGHFFSGWQAEEKWLFAVSVWWSLPALRLRRMQP